VSGAEDVDEELEGDICGLQLLFFAYDNHLGWRSQSSSSG
jgi:hypothetical protein